MPTYGRIVIGAVATVLSIGAVCQAATFGTAVSVRGTVSDIALDETRGRLYVANFGASRIDVVNTTDSKYGLLTPMYVSSPPTSLALSPNNHMLVVGEYSKPGATNGTIALFNLDQNTRSEITVSNPVLSVAFGASNYALVVTTGEFLLLDPTLGRATRLGVTTLDSAPLPVPLGLCTAGVSSFPANIIDAATGLSGDQQTILVLAQVNPGSPTQNCPGEQKYAALLRYHVGDSKVTVYGWTAAPPLAPRTVSVNKDATRLIAGWVLQDNLGADLAEFPNLTASGDTAVDYRLGSHAFDYSRDVIYADVLAKIGEAPVLHLMDTDNLTVRKRIQLPQMMSGRAIFSSDMNTLYTGSDSGVMVLPIGNLDKLPQLAAAQEDVVFQSDICTRNPVSHAIDIVDLAGGNVDFKLSLPDGVSGIALSQTSGTTPAQVTVTVDPVAFQANSGTTTVMLTLSSSKAVNVPAPVRLLINTRDMGQRGQILNVPGKLVDILADPVQNRVYVLRQDKNMVQVYDTQTWKQIDAPALRTGNTPTSMAFTPDRKYLLVGNEHSQLVNVFDLSTLQPKTDRPFIRFDGAYPTSIAVGQGIGTQVVFAAVRDAAPPVTCPSGRVIFRANFPATFGSAPSSLGVYDNCNPTTYTGAPRASTVVASPSAQSVMLAIPDGTVALWDGTVDQWVVSRHDVDSLSGAYGALSDDIFVTGNRVLDQGIYPEAELTTPTTATTSGVALAGGAGSDGLRTTSVSPSGAGLIERIDFNPDDGPFYLQTYHGTPTIEAPSTPASLQTANVGQIGQLVSVFTRTLAVPADRSSVVMLSQSGLTILPPDFDAAVGIPTVTSVTNVAGGTSLAPNEQIFINGVGLAPGSAVAGTEPLPSTLGDACVTVSNVSLPLFWVSPTQIKAQLLPGLDGSEQLIVHSPGGVSAPFTFAVSSTAPAILPVDSGAQAGQPRLVRQKNGQVVNFTNPIHVKESMSIYMTGLGDTTPTVPAGQVTPANPPSVVRNSVTVTLGGTNLPVSFAGLNPGEIGVYRVDVYVPWGVRGASQSPLVITQGRTSVTTSIRVVTP